MTANSNSGGPAIVDVAIVGGGVSGVYCGWRLQEELAGSGRTPDIAVFEYSKRIGGRLMSMKLPGVPSLPAELGGMRFLNSHQRVVQLVDRFRLPTRKLAVEDPEKRNLYYLRGRHFTARDWNEPAFNPPYQLGRIERCRTPGQLLIDVALRYRDVAHQLRDTGFWNLLAEEYGDEAYRLLRDAGGYDTIVNNWSAAEAIPFLLADFAPDSEYMALNSGFDSLPRAIAGEFKRQGGTIHKSHRLHRLDWVDHTQRVRLIFEEGDADEFRFRRDPESKSVIVEASHVILAMPRRSIELLHPDSVIFKDDAFQDALRAVLPQPAFKIFAAYRRPWWKETRGIVAGRSLTDLPIRQCYYWGEEPATTNPDGHRNAVLMASYNDGGAVEFWAGLARHPERYKAPLFACPPGVPLPDAVQSLSASQRLVDEMQKQLRELHGLSTSTQPHAAEIIPPYVAVYQDWTHEPFGGGWHFWKIGVNSRRVRRYMQRPFENLPIAVCGEAWSSQQGWVEGALESADDLLAENFNIEHLV